MRANMKKISVLSGGLDSTILTYKLVNEFGAENVIALTYQYGQKHSIEVEKAKITCSKLKIAHMILDISFLGDIIKNVSALSNTGIVATPTIQEVLGDPQPKTYVPFRNLILTSIALSFAESNGADEVYLGLQQHDLYLYFDTSQEFVSAVNSVAILNRQHEIKIIAPFIDMSKKEEIAIGVKLNVPFEDTWTCYNPVKAIDVLDEKNESATMGNVLLVYSGAGFHFKADTTCPSCAERIQNFAKAGIKDPIKYSKDINWDELIRKFA